MPKTDKLSYEQWLVANKDKLFSAELIHELKHPKHGSGFIDEVKRVVEQEYEDYLKREPLQITIEENQKTRGTVMKTQEEQLAFAKENLRLTNEYSRLHDELKQLKSPEDDAQIKLKLQESRNILRNMQQLSEAYMADKLSYEEFCEKYLLPVEVHQESVEEMQKHGIDEKARREEYQDYLDGKRP